MEMITMSTDKKSEVFGRLESQLTAIANELQALKQATPEPVPTIGRGTRDVTEQANAVAPPADLRLRVELALRGESLDASQLARRVDATGPKLGEILRVLRREGHIWNVGGAEHPVWTWRAGDAVTTQELRSTIERLISERPMTTREITDATGARMSRVNGVMVEIQRSGAKILNLGHGHVYRWLLLSERAKDARLAPKKPKKP